ncbi:nucleotidyltransferase family protein [Luteimonas marina]|uniref:Nucleotidyltransferase family protein n=1 Tax=Luteimonas marina TaxID=488485 RepID=A0A5C5TZY1_9GAMM|nr:nucleotidyltransferase family protein [Luteimonas marina]TWT19048.1 nucleotidyltransferase family protein [Luteimonas marina]
MSAAPATSHAALLLAAGGSRRLGRPKQLLTRDGETLVHRAARLLRETAPQRLLIVVGARRDAIEAAVAGLDAEAVANDDWQAGLSGSLRSAARAMAGFDGMILVAACDQPAMDRQHLLALLAGARDAASHCAATLHDGLPGIPAAVPAAWLTQAAQAGDRGLAARLRALPRETLFLLDAPALAFDIDTPADVDAAIARGWLDPPAAR